MPTYDINIGNRTYTTKEYSDLPIDLSGYVPTSRELTINGVTYDLSIDRSWTLGFNDLTYAYKTANYTLTSNDYAVECNGTFTISLPTAVGIAGRVYVVKNSGVGIITINPNGTETIDESLTAQIKKQNISLMFQSTGTNWIII